MKEAHLSFQPDRSAARRGVACALVLALVLAACSGGAERELDRKIDGWQARFRKSTDRVAELFAENPHRVSPAMLKDRCHSEQAEVRRMLAEIEQAAPVPDGVRQKYDACRSKVATYSNELELCLKGEFTKVPWARSRTHY